MPRLFYSRYESNINDSKYFFIHYFGNPRKIEGSERKIIDKNFERTHEIAIVNITYIIYDYILVIVAKA
jgi:hypothetical protein